MSWSSDYESEFTGASGNPLQDWETDPYHSEIAWGQDNPAEKERSPKVEAEDKYGAQLDLATAAHVVGNRNRRESKALRAGASALSLLGGGDLSTRIPLLAAAQELPDNDPVKVAYDATFEAQKALIERQERERQHRRGEAVKETVLG